MKTLPDGSKAWFVRIRTTTKFKINAISWEGWAVACLYFAVVLGIWLWIGTLRPRGLHVFATIGGVAATLGATALLILIALRKSAPSDSSRQGDITMQEQAIREHFRVEPGYWFVPKVFGFGATPVTWQGWALTLGFVALVMLDIRFMPDPIARVIVGIALAAAFLTICIRKTQGGWRWHWGLGK